MSKMKRVITVVATLEAPNDGQLVGLSYVVNDTSGDSKTVWSLDEAMRLMASRIAATFPDEDQYVLPPRRQD